MFQNCSIKRNLIHRLSIPPFQQKAILVGGDIFLFLLSFMMAFALWTDKLAYYFNMALPKGIGSLIFLPSIFFFFSMIGGVYSIDNMTSFRTLTKPVIKCFIATIIIYGFICLFSGHYSPLRWVLTYYLGVPVAFLVGWRYLLSAKSMNHFFKRRCVILSEKNEARKVVNLLNEHPLYEVVAFFITNGKTRLVNFRQINDLGEFVNKNSLHEIVVAKTADIRAKHRRLLSQCSERGVLITPFSLFYEKVQGRVPIDFTDYQQLSFITHSRTEDRKLYTLFKRIFDVVGAMVGLLGLGLLLPIIALAIRIDSPGPLFYHQKRVGKDGRIFLLWKLRTMVLGAEGDGRAVWADEDDARVTRVGRWLRKMRLDEFPQCWNVLRGEMSIVGPRPERPEFENYLCKKIPFYHMRHSVKPGMAGWAIINHDYVDSVDTAKVRFEYDLYYIKHRSLWFDAMIFLKCFGRLFLMQGR
jgi:exopolysaccharide biosynthesis polyprenyl glycosylphosphotransferase